MGDLRTAGLIAKDATSIGSAARGSIRPASSPPCSTTTARTRFQIAPERAGCTERQLYFPDSTVLISRFMTDEGIGEVLDSMPIERPEKPTGRHRLVRVVRVVRGTMRFWLECALRFD